MFVISDLRIKLKVLKDLASNISDAECRISWLNEFFEAFKMFCCETHKNLNCKNLNKDFILLCMTQILTCLQNLEKIILAEKKLGIDLSIIQPHFTDRIIWCLTKLDSSFIDNVSKEENVADIMYDVISLLNRDGKEETLNKVGGLIEALLTQVITFASVTNPIDLKAIIVQCRNILANIFSKNIGEFNAILLQIDLYQLQNYLRDSLIRLIYETFFRYEEHSIQSFKRLIDTKAMISKVRVKSFEIASNIEKTIQIGKLLSLLEMNSKLQSTITNSLASLEALGFVLIPSIQENSSSFSSQIYSDHFNEEIENFKITIHQSVAVPLFFEGYVDIFKTFLDKFSNTTTTSELKGIHFKGTVLMDHLRINSERVTCDKENLEKFNILLKELYEVTKYQDYFKISEVLKKINAVLKTLGKQLNHGVNGITGICDDWSEMTAEDFIESLAILKSFGISPVIKNMLYANFVDNNSLIKNIDGKGKSINKKMLISMLKKQVSLKLGSLFKTVENSRISLDISDILENK